MGCPGLERIIRVAGSQRLAGKIVGVTQPAVAAWLIAGEVPWEKAVLYNIALGVELQELSPKSLEKQAGLVEEGHELRAQYASLRRKIEAAERDEASR